MTPRMRRLGPPFRRREETTLVDDGPLLVEDRPPVVEEAEAAPPPPPPRPPLLWPWLLLLLLLVLGGLLAAWLLTRDDNGKSASTVNVPNVVRLKQQEAVARLNRRGLVARAVTRASSAAAGTVVAQDPSPGADVARRSVVTLSVSSLRTEAVPDVVGEKAPAAVKALEAKGFRVQTRNVVSKTASGTVLAESPVAGSKIGRGSTVTINISRGPVTVPNTIGQSRDTAVATLRGAGLVPKAFTVPSSQPKGQVVAQRPKSGTRVPGGSTVRLNLSNGAGGGAAPPPPPPPPPPATVTVPDVTVQQQDAAQRQLNSAGLKAGVVWVPSDQPEGTVVSQAPDAGTTQKRGTRIQLNVSLGPNPGEQRAVPNVVGVDPATARSRLESAGFEVQTLRQRVGDRGQVGKVVDEQTAGGRRAPVGARISIYVGRAG
jgi:beta-lactam-binding protein with PASTA domain